MFLPYVGYRISSSAFVNAELVRVTAPIAGRLTREIPRKGDFIDQPAAVTLIESLSRDQRHLLDLVSRHALAKARAELARSQLTEIAATDLELGKRTKIYRDGMIERLGHERDETEAERTGCLAEAGQRREIASRMEQLVKSGVASHVRSAETSALLESIATRCKMADAKLKRLQAELVS
ncbi:MAG: hypothetical protein QOF09_3034, partial [Alphaproteobacteria bacterium]|nr:hypothetical protein [Alphaproteobacteria bacterium]